MTEIIQTDVSSYSERRASWSERIPAALEKAEEELCGAAWTFLDIEEKIVITADEVALARALWGMWRWIRTELGDKYGPDEPGASPPAPLRAFVEKVEAL